MRLFAYARHYRLGSVEQIFIAEQLRQLAEARGLVHIVAALDDALPDIYRGAELRQEAQLLRGPHADSQSAARLDRLADRQVRAIFHHLRSFELLGPDAPPAAARLRQRLFPQGLGAHVQAPFILACGLHEALVRAARESEDTAEFPALQGPLAALEEHADALSRLMAAPQPATRAQIEAAEADGEEALLQVVYLILGTTPRRDRAAVQRRDELLRPLLDGYRRARKEYQRRRRVGDEEGRAAEAGSATEA